MSSSSSRIAASPSSYSLPEAEEGGRRGGMGAAVSTFLLRDSFDSSTKLYLFLSIQIGISFMPPFPVEHATLFSSYLRETQASRPLSPPLPPPFSSLLSREISPEEGCTLHPALLLLPQDTKRFHIPPPYFLDFPLPGPNANFPRAHLAYALGFSRENDLRCSSGGR